MAEWVLCEGRPNKQPHHILAELVTESGYCRSCLMVHVTEMVDAGEPVPASMVHEVLVALRMALTPIEERMTKEEVDTWLNARGTTG